MTASGWTSFQLKHFSQSRAHRAWPTSYKDKDGSASKARLGYRKRNPFLEAPQPPLMWKVNMALTLDLDTGNSTLSRRPKGEYGSQSRLDYRKRDPSSEIPYMFISVTPSFSSSIWDIRWARLKLSVQRVLKLGGKDHDTRQTKLIYMLCIYKLRLS